MRHLTLIAVLAALALGSAGAYAQSGKKPTKKKTTKPPVTKTTKPATGGTDQLPGENCEIGKVYRVGKDYAILVKVLGIEYTSTRVKIGSDYRVPEPGTKFMIVKYDLQNPLKEDIQIECNIDWTAVSATDESRVEGAMQHMTDGSRVLQSLKPAQHLQVFTIIPVPAKGEIPKLMMVSRADGPPVGRFNLKGKVKPIEAPYVDSTDPSGATPLEVVKGVVGKTYQCGDRDVTVEKVESLTGTIEAIAPDQLEDGYEYVLVTIKEGNFNNDSHSTRGGELSVELKDVDSESFSPYNNTIKMSSTQNFIPEIEMGQSVTYRKLFLVRKGTKPATLKVEASGYRPVIIDLTSK